VLLNRLVYGMDPQETLDWPRCHPEDGAVLVEDGVNTLVQNELVRRGHRVTPAVEPLGGGQVIQINHLTGVLSGGSDPRKDGIALGF
jgi:gamma-glutamyltranspeptidase / glutathione hydrolase